MKAKGEFKRQVSSFRNTIGKEDAEGNRYRLYVSYACPWAHRTLITRKLKDLTDYIEVSVAHPEMKEEGWEFEGDQGPFHLMDLYKSIDPNYKAKATVPVLYDEKKHTIVNNESAEIIRIFNDAFDHLTCNDVDLYPEQLRATIDHYNDKIYEPINNGVYKTGFAETQEAYEKHFKKLFEVLEEIDAHLDLTQFIAGDVVTEADIRLFTTLVRFDPVYYVHFKCNQKRIVDFKNLQNYLKSLYQIPSFKQSCHFDHIKIHYYKSHPFINPRKIVPLGPLLDLDSPHGRGEARFATKPRPEAKAPEPTKNFESWWLGQAHP